MKGTSFRNKKYIKESVDIRDTSKIFHYSCEKGISMEFFFLFEVLKETILLSN